jgi:hypothetical protein
LQHWEKLENKSAPYSFASHDGRAQVWHSIPAAVVSCKVKILSQTNNPHAGDLMLSPQPASKQAS